MIRVVRDATLASLYDSVGENLGSYRTGKFEFLELDSSHFHELAQPTDESALERIRRPEDGETFEVDNCIAIFRYLGQLNPYKARDERLWVYLTHTSLLDYTRARWIIPGDDEEAIKHVRKHFFGATNRQIERDNAISRLWWMAHLCDRVQDVELEIALRAFLFRSDVRANIVERPTIAQSRNVFSVILKNLVRSMMSHQKLFERALFRQLMIELNSTGGFRLLDCLPEREIEKLFNRIVFQKLEGRPI